jgi:hypothetical protein
MYVLYKVTKDGNTHTMYEVDTLDELLDHILKHDYRCNRDVYYGVCNTEYQDIGKEDGLTDEERENLPPGL